MSKCNKKEALMRESEMTKAKENKLLVYSPSINLAFLTDKPAQSSAISENLSFKPV